MAITENYRKLIRKDLKELDELITTLENKMKTLRIMTNEMMDVIK